MEGRRGGGGGRGDVGRPPIPVASGLCTEEEDGGGSALVPPLWKDFYKRLRPPMAAPTPPGPPRLPPPPYPLLNPPPGPSGGCRTSDTVGGALNGAAPEPPLIRFRSAESCGGGRGCVCVGGGMESDPNPIGQSPQLPCTGGGRGETPPWERDPET